jgi:hypothetical protein
VLLHTGDANGFGDGQRQKFGGATGTESTTNGNASVFC